MFSTGSTGRDLGRARVADSSKPELLFDRGAQWRQSELNGVPYTRRRYILIIVAVDVSGAGHLPPSNTGVSCLEPLGEAARGFGNDLQATRDCVHPHDIGAEGIAILALREILGQIDLTQNVAKRVLLGVRMHRPHRAPRAGADEA